MGIDTAATLLVTAGDNPERLRSEAAWAHLCGVAPIEASSGKVTRHRLDRGGDRHANQALWRIVMTRLARDPRTRAYLERRTKEGRSKREVIRDLEALRRPRGLQAPSAAARDLRVADLALPIPAVLWLAFVRSADPPLGIILGRASTLGLIRACPRPSSGS